jgi:hypothetical protein
MNDIEKLRILLPHWSEHNAEHASEFRTWAERAREAGEDAAAASIEAAAEQMAAANKSLREAMTLLGGPQEAPPGVHTHHDHSH